MSTTIVVCASKFFIRGFWYYWKHKRVFTNRSFSTLLTTIKRLNVKSMSVATALILDKAVWVERDGLTLATEPETELKEGDEIVLWMVMGNIHYKLRNGKLMLIG